MRAAIGRKVEPELKARRHQMRSAGHWWGQQEAERFLADATDTGDAAAEAFIVASIAAREPLLRSVGAGGDDVREWEAACRKSFASRIAAHRDREAQRRRDRDLRSAIG
jgi:hypothetical protein